jgi:hypothetical protein
MSPAHKGSAHHLAVLTEEAVKAARTAHRQGARPADLAIKYGVTAGAMRRALSGATWKHLTDTESADAA